MRWLLKSILVGCVAALVVTAAVLLYRQMSRHRQKVARQELIDNAIFAFKNRGEGFASGRREDVSTEFRHYTTSACAAAVAKLQTNPDLEHPWPASATISGETPEELRLTYTYVEEVKDLERMVGIVLLDSDVEIGRYVFRDFRLGSARPTAFRYDGLKIRLSDDRKQSPEVGRSRDVSLPRSALFRPLKLKLLGRNGENSYAINVFVDPPVLAWATTRPASK